MLIGINGYKGVGKDTAGQYLVDKYDFTHLAFATRLKEATAALFDIDLTMVDLCKEADTEVKLGTRSMTMRTFLQRFGTEVGRDIFGENFWIEQVIPPDANSWWHKGRKLVITDVRFENEIRATRRIHGYILRIDRPGFEGEGHRSEEYPNEDLLDYTINNHQDVDYLHKLIDCAIEDISEQEMRHVP